MNLNLQLAEKSVTVDKVRRTDNAINKHFRWTYSTTISLLSERAWSRFFAATGSDICDIKQ